MKKSIKNIIALVLVVISVFSICSTAFAEFYAFAGERSLIMREDAKQNSGIKYYFEQGESLTVTGTKGEWYMVKNTSGKTGYSKKSMVTTSPYNPSNWDRLYGAYNYAKTNLKIPKFANVQNDLNRNGVASPKLSVDGICGAKSVQAVKNFQKKYGLSVDGKAGNNTLRTLYVLYH